MHLVSIQVSPHQLRKLKKGHKVRIRKGTGFNLIVHPLNYNIISRAFRNLKGVDVKLSKEELAENQKASEQPELMEEHATETAEATGEQPSMEGKGIFSKIKRGLKTVAPILKPLAKEGLKYAQPKLSEKLAGKPLLQKVADIGMNEASKRLGRGVHRRSMSPPVHGLTRKVGREVAEANNALASMSKSAIDHRIKDHYPTYDELAEQPFAPFSRGYGLHGSHSNSIVGRGGGMVGYGHPYMAPALVSQPYSANYQMAHFLPPHFQHFNNSMHQPHGEGLYAGHGLHHLKGYGMYAGAGLFA